MYSSIKSYLLVKIGRNEDLVVRMAFIICNVRNIIKQKKNKFDP